MSVHQAKRGGGPVVYEAMRIVDEASIDIKAKGVDISTNDFLGGLSNEGSRLYGNGWSSGLGIELNDKVVSKHSCGRIK